MLYNDAVGRAKLDDERLAAFAQLDAPARPLEGRIAGASFEAFIAVESLRSDKYCDAQSSITSKFFQ